MKRILFVVVGYYLVIQAALAALTMGGQPENTIYILPIAGLSGWGAYYLITMARASHKVVANQLAAEIETTPLDKQP